MAKKHRHDARAEQAPKESICRSTPVEARLSGPCLFVDVETVCPNRGIIWIWNSTMSGNGWETKKRKDKDKTRNEGSTNHHYYLIRTLYSLLLLFSFPQSSN